MDLFLRKHVKGVITALIQKDLTFDELTPAIIPSINSAYPLLRSLMLAGFVAKKDDLYSITEEGKKMWEEAKAIAAEPSDEEDGGVLPKEMKAYAAVKWLKARLWNTALPKEQLILALKQKYSWPEKPITKVLDILIMQGTLTLATLPDGSDGLTWSPDEKEEEQERLLQSILPDPTEESFLMLIKQAVKRNGPLLYSRVMALCASCTKLEKLEGRPAPAMHYLADLLMNLENNGRIKSVYNTNGKRHIILPSDFPPPGWAATKIYVLPEQVGKKCIHGMVWEHCRWMPPAGYHKDYVP